MDFFPLFFAEVLGSEKKRKIILFFAEDYSSYYKSKFQEQWDEW